jgi:hypothetical protein
MVNKQFRNIVHIALDKITNSTASKEFGKNMKNLHLICVLGLNDRNSLYNDTLRTITTSVYQVMAPVYTFW